MYPQAATVLRHSPVACQRNPISQVHTRKSDSTLSCRKSAACQHKRKSVWTVSRHKSAAGCRIKQETRLHHSPVACQCNPTSKMHTRKSDSTVSCRKSVACQHTRQSVSTVSHCSSVASRRIKQVTGGRHSPVAGQSCRKSAADCRIIPTTKGNL